MTRRDQPDPVTKAPEARGPNGALTDTFRFRPDKATTRQCIPAPFAWLTRLLITTTPERPTSRIEPNSANLIHRRFAQIVFALTQPHYGTSMPQSGCRPRPQKLTWPERLFLGARWTFADRHATAARNA
jgi:hypothetical protein